MCLGTPIRCSAALAPGPDAYGYTVAPTGAFTFTNIATTGTKVLNFDDDAAATVNIGFSFRFYGTNYSTVAFNPNGLMSFAGASTDYSNVNLTIRAPSNNLPVIAVLWCDYETESVGADAVYYKTIGGTGGRQFIVQWNQVMLVPGAGLDTITFQARLFEGSNRVLLSYSDVVVADDPSYSNGAFATVGVRDINGQLTGRNLLWSHDQPAVTNGMHLLIQRTNGSPVAVNDAAATPKNMSVMVSPLLNDSDPDGDPLSLASVSATNGAAGILAGTNVLFLPQAGFTGTATVGYTVGDPNGGSATGLVLVTVWPWPTISSISRDSSGTTWLQAAGMPGRTNRVEASSNLANWGIIGSAYEDPAGIYQFQDWGASNVAKRFYRLRE